METSGSNRANSRLCGLDKASATCASIPHWDRRTGRNDSASGRLLAKTASCGSIWMQLASSRRHLQHPAVRSAWLKCLHSAFQARPAPPMWGCPLGLCLGPTCALTLPAAYKPFVAGSKPPAQDPSYPYTGTASSSFIPQIRMPAVALPAPQPPAPPGPAAGSLGHTAFRALGRARVPHSTRPAGDSAFHCGKDPWRRRGAVAAVRGSEVRTRSHAEGPPPPQSWPQAERPNATPAPA